MLSPGEIQAIVSAGSKGKIPPVAVANNAPTPTLRWSGTVVATVLHNFIAAATDPSPVDQAAGFAYSINWGDGSPIQLIGATAGNGNGVTLSHVFPAAGTYSVTLLATDKDHGTRRSHPPRSRSRGWACLMPSCRKDPPQGLIHVPQHH